MPSCGTISSKLVIYHRSRRPSRADERKRDHSCERVDRRSVRTVLHCLIACLSSATLTLRRMTIARTERIFSATCSPWLKSRASGAFTKSNPTRSRRESVHSAAYPEGVPQMHAPRSFDGGQDWRLSPCRRGVRQSPVLPFACCAVRPTRKTSAKAHVFTRDGYGIRLRRPDLPGHLLAASLSAPSRA